MKIRQDPSKPVKIYDDRDETRKSMKTCENPWKPVKIHQSPLNSLMTETRRENLWKSVKTRQNSSKPVKFRDDRNEMRKSVKIRQDPSKPVKFRDDRDETRKSVKTCENPVNVKICRVGQNPWELIQARNEKRPVKIRSNPVINASKSVRHRIELYCLKPRWFTQALQQIWFFEPGMLRGAETLLMT